ncbi:FAD-dependent oxidoreductase [Pyrodictium abyssi]|uniref:CoA-disulfide reductase n=1 Tax=Pyrodictium abyssi TaxID=54256 RepID=A0ABN6ZNW3_9CREN|nr:CoA-disulfide reductase [Pyrodictium abyssi]
MVVRVAVIGGGAAGMAAASRVKRLLGDKAEVTVFEKGSWVSFALCGTPYYLGCRVPTLDMLVHYPLEEFTRRRGIDVRLKTIVTEVDPEARRLRYRSLGTGEEGEYEYDYLVLATGARPRVPGERLRYRNVYTLHSLGDADRLRAAAVRNDVKRVVVIGGGYTGVEAAENLARLGRRVILVHSGEWLLNKMLDRDMAGELNERAQAAGIELVLGRRVASIEGSGDIAVSAVLDNGERIDGDLFLAASGIEPNTVLAEKMGLRIGETGAVWTDERMRTSLDGVYAVGDVAETRDLVTGGRVWWPFAPAANKMGFVAGTNIAGGEAVFPGVVRTSALGAFGLYVAATGLSEEEARRRGFDAVSARVKAPVRARYMGEPGEILLKVVADARTGRLLGAQAVSSDPSSFWRINVVASLIWMRATVWDLFSMDLGYWPGLNPVWDPLTIAARLLFRELGTTPHGSHGQA